MDLEREKRVHQLLDEVLDLGPAERREFLVTACGEDRALFDEVWELAEHDDDDLGSFIERPAYPAAAQALRSGLTPQTGQRYVTDDVRDETSQAAKPDDREGGDKPRRWWPSTPGAWGLTAAIGLIVVGLGSEVYRSHVRELSARDARRVATTRVEAATRELDRAEIARDEARRVSRFLIRLFGELNPKSGEASEVAVSRWLERGSETVRSELADQPLERALLLAALAGAYRELGWYEEALPLIKESVELRRTHQPPDHPDIATTLAELGILFQQHGDLDAAAIAHQESLDIRRRSLGPSHSQVADSLSDLAATYQKQGRLAEAEPLLRLSVEIQERAAGPEHPTTVRALLGLAKVTRRQQRFHEAEFLYRRVLSVREQRLEPSDPALAEIVHELAELRQLQGQAADAEQLFRRALTARREALGQEHPATVASLAGLGELYLEQGRATEADPLLRQALAIRQRTLAPDHEDLRRSTDAVARLRATS